MTFDLVRTIKTPLLSGALAVFDLLTDWLQRNSRRPEPSDGPVGPTFNLPVGPGAGLTAEFYRREVLSMADDDAFNFNGVPGFFSDTGWVFEGGIGVLSVSRMVQTGSENSGGPIDGNPDDLQSGFTGQTWQLFDQQGNGIGEIGNGDRITKTVAQTGSYSLIGQRTVLGFRDLEGNQQPFPTEFPEPERPPLDLPELDPLRQEPAAPPAIPQAPPVAPPAPQEPVPVPLRTPQRRPGEQPARRPALPSAAPASPARLRPATPGGALAVAPDAGPLAPPATRPVPTPPGQEFLPGQRPIPNSNPRPTPEGIAQEAGRLEGKLALLLATEPGQGGGGAELLPLLEEIRAALVEVRQTLLTPDPGGLYQLNPSCTGPDGSATESPVFVDVSPAPTAVAGIAARVDAVAALIQGHKDLSQPICRTPSRASNVTVQFEEI